MFPTTSTLFFHIDNSFQVSNKINNTIIVYITKTTTSNKMKKIRIKEQSFYIGLS